MSTPTTPLVAVAPYLDDPVRFAAHLFSCLAAAGDPRILDAAGAAEQEDGDASEAATLAHSAGVAFGVAAEQLRQALVAGGDELRDARTG
ncbi:MAG: hypothetical protein M3R02_11820 [Chloroflexota bacterium]|nr:hypothetical protein [Chloroflexota bacterium]